MWASCPATHRRVVERRGHKVESEVMPLAMSLLAVDGATIGYLVPLAAAISLVYSASRFELTERVLRRAGRLFVTIVGFMLSVLIVLSILSWVG